MSAASPTVCPSRMRRTGDLMAHWRYDAQPLPRSATTPEAPLYRAIMEIFAEAAAGDASPAVSRGCSCGTPGRLACPGSLPLRSPHHRRDSERDGGGHPTGGHRRPPAPGRGSPVADSSARTSTGPITPEEAPWSIDHFIALTQLTVDVVALSSGLDGNLGAPRPAVIAEMTRAAAAMAPARPADEHAHVAVHVLDHLLRHDEPTPFFPVGYADPDKGWQATTQPVRVLYETLAADGSTLHVNVDNTAVACRPSRPTGRWKTSMKRSSRSCRPRPIAGSRTLRSTPPPTRSPSHAPTPRTCAG